MTLPTRKISPSFTLVELLIVVSIIAILTAAIIPSMSGYLNKQTVKNAREQFKNDLVSLENKSLTGTLSNRWICGDGITCGTTTNKIVAYWVIKWWEGQNYYRIYVTYDFYSYGNNKTPATHCLNLLDPGDPASDTRPQSKITLPKGATFSGTGGAKCLFFRMSDGAIVPSVAGSNTITLNGLTTGVIWNYAGMIRSVE